MKKYLLIVILLFLGLSLNAQAPQGFNYQATVRNASGGLIVNKNVSFSFNIIQGSQTGNATYSEDHTVLTDDLGQVSLVIGQGSPTAGVFSEIDWSIGNYYLAIELDTGNGFESMGASQLLSVPYALYAENAGGSLPQGISNGDTLKWNASTNLWEISSSNSSANNAFEVKSTQVGYYSNNSASSGGEIIADGGSSVIARGVVWGVNPDPMIDGDTTTDGEGSGVFTSELTNLAESTTYYYRAYATNSNRTVYGSTYTFKTMNSADDNDGDGYSVADGDCNDLDFNINPSAFEIQDDGIDQNCDGTDSLSPVYLSSNGVTIKAHSWASFGDVGTINGKEYVVVNRETLISMAAQNMDYSAVCTSLITDMSSVFASTSKNYDISGWDVGNVINMSSMFSSCNLGVNHEMNLWDVSKVENMASMFLNSDFNGYIYAWDTSSVTNMSNMFNNARAFNQSIANWNTSSVTNMSNMFNNARAFNQSIANWNISSVIDMSTMFNNAWAFNQNLSSWDTSSVTNMSNMFNNARAFNQNLSSWDTSSVTNMYSMFYFAISFNQDLSSWNVLNVTNYTNFSNYTNSWTLPKPNFN
jgi:surface protein